MISFVPVKVTKDHLRLISAKKELVQFLFNSANIVSSKDETRKTVLILERDFVAVDNDLFIQHQHVPCPGEQLPPLGNHVCLL